MLRTPDQRHPLSFHLARLMNTYCRLLRTRNASSGSAFYPDYERSARNRWSLPLCDLPRCCINGRQIVGCDALAKFRPVKFRLPEEMSQENTCKLSAWTSGTLPSMLRYILDRGASEMTAVDWNLIFDNWGIKSVAPTDKSKHMSCLRNSTQRLLMQILHPLWSGQLLPSQW